MVKFDELLSSDSHAQKRNLSQVGLYINFVLENKTVIG